MGLTWTDEENAVLTKLYPNPQVSKEDIQKVFHYRTWMSVQQHATKLNLRRGIGERPINHDYLEQLEERLKLPDRVLE